MKYIKLLVLLFVILVSEQNTFGKYENSEDLRLVEDSLNHYFTKLVSETNDARKIELNNHIIHYFKQALKNENSFTYQFDSLKFVGVILSPDEKLRIITWNLPYNDRTYQYFGFVQYKKTKKSYEFYELFDKSEQIKKPEQAILNTKNWYGALYYKIIVNKSNGTEYYTLLGADLNNLFTKKKIVDILYFDKNGFPVFGKKVFKNKTTPISRVIFEFSAQTNMTLTYDDEKEMIIYDHLSPSRPSLEGQFEFYGPDFSYDGLKFERGIWNAYSDIDVRNYNIE
jgi:hypothetical protein